MKALIVHTGGGLGDVLLSGPVIDSLQQAGYETHFLARKGTSQAIQDHPSLSKVMTIDGKDPKDLKGMKAWAARIRAEQYDICFLLWSTSKWAWTLYHSGVPKRVGQDSRLLYSFLFTNKVAIRSEKGDEDTHWTEILLDYVRAANIPVAAPELKFQSTSDSTTEAKSLVSAAEFGDAEGPLIGFHSGKGLPLTLERWPAHHFANLAAELQANLGARLILTGGPSEVAVVNHISNTLSSPHLNLAGKTSLSTLAAVAKECDLFVCPDSGPMHLAAAVGTPVVGIYALDEDFPQRWAPFGVPHRIIRPPRPACPPGCQKPTCPNFGCYLKVSPQSVTEACSDLLRELSSPTQRNLPN